MKITKVKYEKLFPVAAYVNEKIGFEAEIGVGGSTSDNPSETGISLTQENPLQAIEKLRVLAEQSHREKYPHLYTDNGQPITYETITPPALQDTTQRDLLIKELEEATTTKQVEIIYTEAKDWYTDSVFIDAVLKNKLRLNKK